MQNVAIRPQDRELGRAYREFSRHRFQQLRTSSRIMRESDMIQLILREWDSMTDAQKKNFMNGYSFAYRRNTEVMRTPPRRQLVAQRIARKTAPVTTGIKEDSSDEEEEERSASEQPAEQMPAGRMPAAQLERTPLPKSKAISKPRSKTELMRDYVSFYRFQYKRLSEEHPNWPSAKISVIIGLRWKKEKLEVLRARRVKNSKKTKVSLPASGRVTFRKVMAKVGLDMAAIRRKWKKLPSESKKLWERRGDPSKAAVDRTMQQSMVKLPGMVSVANRELTLLMDKK
jgi:hypothetical protein